MFTTRTGPNTFQDGLSAFHRATGWNITAHNRMWATDNVYAKRNGGNFSWIVDKKVAVPTQQEFWHYLMAQGKGWGLYVYEQDWLEKIYIFVLYIYIYIIIYDTEICKRD